MQDGEAATDEQPKQMGADHQGQRDRVRGEGRSGHDGIVAAYMVSRYASSGGHSMQVRTPECSS